MRSTFAVPLLLALAACKPSDDVVGACPSDWTLGEVVDTEGCGTLARMPAPWGTDLWIIRVEGTHYQMGFQYGRLLGPTMIELWWTYMGAIAEEAGLEDAELTDQLLGSFMDEAWLHYEPNVPEPYLEEFQGIADGMQMAGVSYGDDNLLLPIRMVTMIDLAMSSQLDMTDIMGVTDFIESGYSDALREYYGLPDPAALDPEMEQVVRAARETGWKGSLTGAPLSCSYFAAWGDRTDDGGLYATRNMDFTADTGISDLASIAVFVPDDGIPYASISWVGANLGVLGGMSREGIAVSAVGASSPYERIKTEPALLRARDALETATSLEDALPYLDGSSGDDIVRAPTIGYNALVAWGDPRNDGAGAQAVILENNGLSTGVFLHDTDCSVESTLLRFDADGVPTTLTTTSDPDLVNTEGEAEEIDADANVRLFAWDTDHYVLDAYGNYIEDPDGVPIQTGYPMDCALYRGDEAMAYGVRQHQDACNGPADGGDGLMIQGGSYRKRYTPMREMLAAYEAGTSYTWEEVEVIADNGGVPVPVGLDQAEALSRVAAMDENVWDIVYDATDLVVRLSYESGTGDTWTAASDQAEFLEIDLEALFLVE